LTTRFEKTKLTEKMIEEDVSRVEESATKSTYRLGVGFERCGDKDEKSAPKFISSSTYHKEEATIKHTKAHYPSFNPKREVRKETLKPTEEAFVYMFCGRAGHMDEYCFRQNRIEKSRFEYARNSYLMSSLIFHLALTLVPRLTLLHVFCVSSLIDLTIDYMILVHDRIDLYLDALDTAHVLIMGIVFHVGVVFLLEGLTPILRQALGRSTFSLSWFSSHSFKW
jgi:hypothetical protein